VGGDADFADHGPRVNETAHINTDVSDPGSGQFRGTLNVLVSMSAVETTSDFTSATGSRNTLLYQAPLGNYVFLADQITRTDTVSYVDTDHASDVLAPGNANSFVAGYTFVGDTAGDEAGTETLVTINTKQIHLKLSTCPSP
jgi:hypothetical protein